MKIAYHKDKQSGKITRHYKLNDNLTMEEISKKVKEYNSPEGKTDCVYAVEVKDGSFLEYLIERCDKNIAYKKESVGYAIEAIEDALDAVRSLEVSYD